MPSDGAGWQSKDVITWMILIWGFYRLANPPSTMAAACNFGAMTQTMTAPQWTQLLGVQSGNEVGQ